MSLRGAILGPTLYNLYVNDIINLNNRWTIELFADDTNVLITGKNEQELILQTKNILKQFEQWFIANGLKLNTNKTKIIIFKNKNKKN